MDPLFPPTTAPHQPDPPAEEHELEFEAPLIERGWMETQPRPVVASEARPGDSTAITAFTAAVVIGFVILCMFAGPLVLLYSYGT